MSQERPRDKAPSRSTSARTRPAPTTRRYAPPPPPPRRDPFPFLMGGIIGALVVGLMVVVFLITSNNGGNNSNVNPPVGAVNTPIAPAGQIGTPLPAEEPAPRMTMDQFKALYDDPAKRPFIVDVRPKAAYDEGHIAGAVSIPEAEVDVRIAEFPKDRLIVAYCQ